MSRVQVRRWAAWLAVAVLAATGCTQTTTPSDDPSTTPPGVADPTPTTQSGLRVAFVLPPPSATYAAAEAALRTDLARVQRAAGRDIATSQVVQPDAPVFTADVVALLAEEGNDLVCALGAGAAEAVLAVAPDFPETRFCVAPARLEPAPANVLSVDVRVEETAFLAGAAAGIVAADSRPGFVAGSSGYAIDRRRRAFVSGMAAVSARTPGPAIAFPADGEERGFELAADQLAQGVRVIYTVAGAADAGVQRAVEEGGALLIGSLTSLGGEPEAPPSAETLMTISERFDLALEPVIAQAAGEWRGGVVSVGLTESVLSIAGGGSPRWQTIIGRIGELRDGILNGTVDPLPEG